MNMLELNLFILKVSNAVAAFAINWLLHSTLLISAGLFAAWVFRNRGSAFQSVAYRTTLAAVVMCPFVSLALSCCGVTGWSLQLPPTFDYRQAEVAALVSNSRAIVDESESDTSRLPATQFTASDSNTGRDDFADGMPFSTPPDQDSPGDAGVAVNDSDRSLLSEPATVVTAMEAEDLPSSQEASAEVVTGPADTPVLSIFRFGMVTIVLVVAWVMVAAILFVRLAFEMIRTSRWRSQAIEATAVEIEVCARIASEMNVTAPLVLRAPFITSPCLHGLRRPAVMLPDVDDLPLEDVFVHELAHLQRYDCHWRLLRQMMMSILFFQPLLWWLSRRIDATAEEVCDDYVVQHGGSREGYANSLVDIAALSVTPPAIVCVGMVSLRSMIGRRVGRIMDTSRSLSTRVGSFLLMLVIGSGLIGTTITGFVGLSSESSSAVVAAPLEDESRSAADPDESTEPELIEANGGTNTPDNSSTNASVKEDQPGRSQPVSAKPSAETTSAETTAAVRGWVVDHEGHSVAAARLYWFRTRVHDIDPMPPKLVATTDPDGNFQFDPPVVANPDQEPANWSFHEHIVVVAEGHGFVTTHVSTLRRKMQQPDSLIGVVAQALDIGSNSAKIELPAAGESLRGRIVDIDGQPVVGVTVRIRNFNEASFNGYGRSRSESPDTPEGIWEPRVKALLNVIEPVCQRFALPAAKTNSSGEFELKNVGHDRIFQLLVEGDGIQSADVIARNVDAQKVQIPANLDFGYPTLTVHGNGFLYVAGPSRPVIGRVTDAVSGLPVSNAVVRAFTVHGERVHSSRERQHFATRTDTDGRYQISGLPIGNENRLAAFTMDDTPYIPVGQQVDTSRGDAVADFSLHRGVWAEGRVIDGTTGEPFTGEMSYYWFRDRSLEAKIPGLRQSFVDGLYYTNRRGEFRIPVLATRGILAYRWDGQLEPGANARPIDKFPRGLGAESIDGKDDRMNVFPTMPSSMHAGNYNYVAEVHPQAGEESVHVELTLRSSQPIQLRIVSGELQEVPSSGYLVYGLNERWGWQRDQNRELIVEDLLPQETRKVFVFHRRAGMAGSAIVDENAKQPVEITLTESGSVKGRLFDKSGDLITDGKVTAVYEKLRSDEPYAIWASDPGLSSNPTQIPVDQEGRFELDGLIPGWKYSARVSAPRKMQGRMMNIGIGLAFSDLEIQPGESRDLGDVTVAYPSQNELQAEENKADENRADENRADENKAGVNNVVEDKVDVNQKSDSLPKESAQAEQPSSADTNTAGSEPLGFGGQVLDPDGKPVSGLTVYASIPMKDLSGITAVTDAEGRFVFHGNRSAFETAVRERARSQTTIITADNGNAPNRHVYDWRSMLLAELPGSHLKMQLREVIPVKGRIVSAEGRPLANIEVTAAKVSHPAGGMKEYMRRAQEDRLTYAATADELSMGDQHTTRTDTEGRFQFDTFGSERIIKLKLHGDGVADSEIVVMTRAAPDAAREFGTLTTTGTGNVPHYFAEFTHVAPASRTLQGIVLDENTGHPLAGIAVSCLASGHGAVTTNADGRFRFPGCLKAAEYQFNLISRTQPYFGKSLKVPDTAGLKPLEMEFKLRQGITARGMVTDGSQPLSGVVYYNVLYPSPFADRINGVVPSQGYSEANVQSDGSFEIQVLPGPGILAFSVNPSANPDVTYLLPQVTHADLDKVLGDAAGRRRKDETRHVSIHLGGPRVSAVGIVNHQALALLSPAETTNEIQVHLTATPGRNLNGYVVDADGNPVTRVDVSQLGPQRLGLEPVAGNEFVVRGLGAGRPRRIVFYQADLRQGAVLDLTGDENPDTELKVSLQACGSVTGTLVDAQGSPVKNALVALNRGNYSGNPNTWSARSGENGEFEIEGLVPGETYHGRIGAQTAAGYVFRDVVVESGMTVDLGQVEVSDALMPSTKK